MKHMLGIALLALIVLSVVSCFDMKKISEIEKLTVEPVEVSKVKDGDYDFYADYSIVTAKVLVSVKSGAIIDIKLLEHKHGPGKEHGAEKIIDRVLKKQSLSVDTVAGATTSSKIILKAIESALKKGL